MTPQALLYSFRRCPYAIRARLALAQAQLAVEVREVALKAKPPELLDASAKGTVPVLRTADGMVFEESLAIMGWALGQTPAGREAWQGLENGPGAALIATCDGPFKLHLDGFRYGTSHPNEHRRAAVAILQDWNGWQPSRLTEPKRHQPGWSPSDGPCSPSCANFGCAIPRVLQVNRAWKPSRAGLPPLRRVRHGRG